jgi:hypothetical protein
VVSPVRVLTVHFARDDECPPWAWPLLPFQVPTDSAVQYEWFHVRKYAAWSTQACARTRTPTRERERERERESERGREGERARGRERERARSTTQHALHA